MNESQQTRDVVLAPNQFAWVLDTTKGNIAVYVGPSKTSLSQTDQPVILGPDGSFQPVANGAAAIQRFAQAVEGDYLVLENPAYGETHPPKGAATPAGDLFYGQSANIPGPVTFPLWPGQRARVVPGHQLRTNQYLVARVVNRGGSRVLLGALAGDQPHVVTRTARHSGRQERDGDRPEPVGRHGTGEGARQRARPGSSGRKRAAGAPPARIRTTVLTPKPSRTGSLGARPGPQ